MAIDGGLKCVKFLMCFFNCIFLLFGLALVILGIVNTTQFVSYDRVFQTGFSTAAIVLIVLGIVVALVSFFGCFGAMRENKCLINMFILCVFILLVAQIAGVVLAYVKRNEAEKAVGDVLYDVVKKYKKDVSSQEFMDVTQHAFLCCGSHNYTDYIGVFDGPDDRVPTSCCIKKGSSCNTKINPGLPGNDYYEEGCQSKLTDFLRGQLFIVGGVALGVCFIELLAIIFGLCLTRNINRYEMV